MPAERRSGWRTNSSECEEASYKDKSKQASGSDSIRLQCRYSRIAYLVSFRGALAPWTRPTPHDLGDFDPQCHLIRTPTADEAFSPASWPSYTRLDHNGFLVIESDGSAGVAGFGLAGWEADGLRRESLSILPATATSSLSISSSSWAHQSIPSVWTGIPSTGSITKGGQR